VTERYIYPIIVRYVYISCYIEREQHTTRDLGWVHVKAVQRQHLSILQVHQLDLTRSISPAHTHTGPLSYLSSLALVQTDTRLAPSILNLSST